MTGIFLLLVVGLWAWLSLKLAVKVTRKLSSSNDGGFFILFFFLLFMAIPVSDEIVGGFQFRALCSEHAVFRFGVSNLEGRTTKLTISPSHAIVPRTTIPISYSGYEYRDVTTDELVVKYRDYSASGGGLIRLLGISESNSPLTFEGSCSPQNERHEDVRLTFKFNVVK